VTGRTDAISVFAPAKINLCLHVGEKRADGFHALQSLVAFADIGDVLEFSPAETLELIVAGPFAETLREESDNLVLRAARLLAGHARCNAGATITLTKNLPVASGIGGGSADAAAALLGLAKLWQLNIARGELAALAATLGSDVPVCLDSKPAWMEGRGERIAPAGPLPIMAMVLVNPGVAVATADVFRSLAKRRGTGTLDHTARLQSPGELMTFLRTTGNDLEVPARALAPAIVQVLDELARMPGVELARMSGSGATCFALFEDGNSAEMAAIALSHSHPQWWVKATQTLNQPVRQA